MKKQFNIGYGVLLAGFIVLSHFSLKAQDAQVSPRIKTARTAVYRAVLKDTAWTTGAIVDYIYYVKFDKQGRKWIENSLNPDGSANRKIIYKYGPDGKVEEEIVASVAGGGITEIYQYSYDKWGKLDSLVQMNRERNVKYLITVIRDDQGKIAETVKANKDESRITTLDFVYDDQIWVKVATTEKGKLITPPSLRRTLVEVDTIFKRYSERNSLQPRTPKKRKVDFEYDAFGNWIRRTEYNGVDPEFIVLRTIEYEGQDDEWMDLGLNGKVKSVYQTSYVAIPKGPGSIDKGAKKGIFFYYEFDQKGRKTLAKQFTETGTLKGSTEYVYGNKGYIEKEIRKSSAGEVESVLEWIYDADDRLKNKSWYDAKGNILKKGVFRYDLEGNCITEIWFNKESEKIGEFHYQFNPYGQQIEEKIVLCRPEFASGHESRKRIWNLRGRLVEEWVGDPQNLRHYTYNYSSRGEVISGTEALSGGEDVKYVYKFFNDEHDNWKKKVKFIEDVPVVYEEREYTYYD